MSTRFVTSIRVMSTINLGIIVAKGDGSYLLASLGIWVSDFGLSDSRNFRSHRPDTNRRASVVSFGLVHHYVGGAWNP